MKRKRGKYQFTTKEQSKTGIFSLLLSGLSILGLGMLIGISYRKLGVADIMIGVYGILFLCCNVWSFYLAICSIKNKDTYKKIPMIALVISTLTLICWGWIYIGGMF